MISESYRNHRGVTGSMNFKKNQEIFFSENRAPVIFGEPDCHPITLIDLAKIDVASKGSAETISMICESYRTHRGFTGPMDFKSRTFLWQIVLPGFWGTWLPSKHLN